MEKNEKDFRWIGESLAIKSRRNTKNYKAFTLNGIRYNIDDFVLIRNDDSVDPEDTFNCYVAQITDLYDTGGELEPYQAKVKWFSRISDLPEHCRKSLDKLYENEVVIDNRQNWTNMIDAETIFNKCLILSSPASNKNLENMDENGFPIFFCRYKLMSNKLKPLDTNYAESKFCSTSNRKGLEKKQVKYCAIETGSPQFPRVLIKKIDKRILECKNENIKILVAKPDVEDVAQNLDDLSLRSPSHTSTRKSPYIHSLTSTSSSQNGNDLAVNYSPNKMVNNQKLNTYKQTKEYPSPRRSSNRLHYTPKKEEKITNELQCPSPSKKIKTPRRLEFSVNSECSVTRSGRKVKPVLYSERNSSEDESKERAILSVKKKMSKFIRATYSDDSGSESAYSTSNESSSEELDSDTASNEKPLISKKNQRTPKSNKKTLIKKKTLSIPDRKTPSQRPRNVLEESRLRLHVSAVPKSLPCREEEFTDVYGFVKGCLCSQTGGCMYISGVPGTGKTATVHEVIRRLEEEKEEGEIPIFSYVEVNGMWMTDPYQCYVHIFKSLTGKTIAAQQAANLLEKRFTEPGPKKDAVILLVDELDRLWTRKQTVMYNIFDWPSKKHSKLIVLAIANTMDLPERLMMNRISSRLGLTRRTFHPYNFKQLQQIIMSRIQELQVFDSDAVQLVSRKVAAVSGDARRALDICRHATEVAELSKFSPKKKSKILVGMEHVDVAIQRMFSSPMISAIRASSKMEKIFFQCILADFVRTGSEETTLLKVSQHLASICRLEGLEPPNDSIILKMCASLSHSHLLLVDNFRNGLYMKIRLNASPDDVNFALTGKVI